MLPRIDAQQRDILPHDGVLVGIGTDFHRARLRVLDEPGPAAALDPSERRIELALEGGEVTVRGINRGLASPSVVIDSRISSEG